MRAPKALAIAFALALGGGMAAVYAVIRLGVWVMFEGSAEAGTFVTWLAPLGGVAVFALIYGLGRGRAMRLWFWVLAPLAAYAAAVLGSFAVGQGASVTAGVVLAAVLASLAAFALLFRDARGG